MLIFEALGRNHIVWTGLSPHHNAMFLLNRRILLVRFSSKLVINRRHREWLGLQRRTTTAHSRIKSLTTPNQIPRYPLSQSFNLSYEFFSSTSLTCILPKTRGSSPWIPDADMSTTWNDLAQTISPIFKYHCDSTRHRFTITYGKFITIAWI